MCLGRKAKKKRTISDRTGNTTPFIISSRPTNQAPGAVNPANPNVKRYSPIVRAAPIRNNQQQSPAGGFGDLGGPSLGGQMIRVNAEGERLAGANDRRSSVSSMSSVPSTSRINASIGVRPEATEPAQRVRSPPPPAVVVINHHPARGNAPRASSSSSTSSRVSNHAPSAVNARGPAPGFRVNMSTHSSLV